MKKKITVEVVFKQFKEGHIIKLNALHNGKYMIAKHKVASDDKQELFEVAAQFIEEYDADHISLKRGFIEDQFAKYLADNKDKPKEEDIVIEGVHFNSISAQYQPLLADLKTYKDSVDETILQEDFISMIYQGVLYNETRREIEKFEGVDINPFEYTVDVGHDTKESILNAIDAVNEIEEANDSELFQVNKYNNFIKIKRTDYVLNINLVDSSEN